MEERMKRAGEEIKWVDGGTFNAVAAAGDLVVISFSRREVQACQVGDAIDRLLNFSDDSLNVSRFRDSLTFVFEELESDRREIYEVATVVRFFRELTTRWPYWTHFVEKSGDTASMVVTLLCDVDVVATEAGISSCCLRHPEQLQDVLLQLFDGQNALYEAHDLSGQDNMAMTDAFLSALHLS